MDNKMEVCTINTKTFEEEIQFAKGWIVLKTPFGRFNVMLEKDGLVISGHGRISVSPNAANSITIKERGNE